MSDPDEHANAYREAAQHLLELLNSSFFWLHLKGRTPLAFWALVYALGLPIGSGENIARRARELRVTRAALDKKANEIRRELGLPQGVGFRSAEACRAYSQARIAQLL